MTGDQGTQRNPRRRVILRALAALGLALLCVVNADVASWAGSLNPSSPLSMTADGGDSGAMAITITGAGAYGDPGPGDDISIGQTLSGWTIHGSFSQVYRLRIKMFCGFAGTSVTQESSTGNAFANDSPTATTTHGNLGDCTGGRGFDHLEFWQVNSSGSDVEHLADFDPTGSPDDTSGPSDPPSVAAGACTLSDEQLVMVARAAGWDESDVSVAVAVALAESGGVVNAVHYNAGDDSYDIGLWQINDRAHPVYDRDQLGTDPFYNAESAHDVFEDAGPLMTPWATFNSGAYAKYVARANRAMASTGSATLSMTNCTGADGHAPGSDSGNPSGDDGSCSGWNPLTYVKCALVWAFVPPDGTMTQWTTLYSTASAKPPLSLVVGGGTDLIGMYNVLYGETVGGVPNTAEPSLPSLGDESKGEGLPMLSALDTVRATTWGGYFYDAIAIAMWAAMLWNVWRLVEAYFGGKS
jgi:HAMP domain-containing protein